MEEENTPKKNKISSVEIFVILIVLLGLSFYFIPKGLISFEKRQYAILQTNAAMVTSKILAEFSDNEQVKDVEKISKLTIEELNASVKNPIKPKFPAYTLREECLGCVVLFPDKKIGNITLVAHDKEGEIVTRTVIQPPSYVTYNKEFDSK